MSNKLEPNTGQRLEELLQHFKDPASKQRVIDSGIANIDATYELTAYEAWRLFGGIMVTGPNNKQLRGKGTVFATICRLMAGWDLVFKDLDPKGFNQYSRSAWQALGLDLLAATALGEVEIFDIGILSKLTDEDIEELVCIPYIRREIRQLRETLLAA